MTKAQIKAIRKDTLDQTKALLDQHCKCCVIRPTGFGKTYMLAEIARTYQNVLFFYPKEVICDGVKAQLGADISKVTFASYAKLARKNKKLFDSASQYDLIICDEAHALGATKTKVALEAFLRKTRSDVHLLGATATPNRSDLDDFLAFFGYVTPDVFTLHDAIKIGMLPKPWYCYYTYDSTDIDEMSERIRLAIEKIDDPQAQIMMTKLLAPRQIEIAKLHNMPNIIKDVCDTYAPTTAYMKFIVFFSTKANITDLGADVVEWFREAYPTHEIHTLEISTRNKTTQTNHEFLPTLTYRKNRIDLIFAVDMMTLGYHVDDLTGICMYRGTQSNVCFTQQLGRAFSSNAKHAPIIFDWVDNLHRKSVFEILRRLKTKTMQDKLLWQTLTMQYEHDPTSLTAKEFQKLQMLNRRFLHNPDADYGEYLIDPADLVATGHMQTFKELEDQLLLKIQAEAEAARIRLAWDQWIENGGDPGADPTQTTFSTILKQMPPEYLNIIPFCDAHRIDPYKVLEAHRLVNDLPKDVADVLVEQQRERLKDTRRPQLYSGRD